MYSVSFLTKHKKENLVCESQSLHFFIMTQCKNKETHTHMHFFLWFHKDEFYPLHNPIKHSHCLAAVQTNFLNSSQWPKSFGGSEFREVISS